MKLQISSTPAHWLLLSLCLLGLTISSSSQAVGATTDTAVIKSPNDEREYLRFTLENGLSVVVVSDPTTDQAAASLNVQVGSGDDPEDFAGLAHFLEHMLFLGTEKYPQPDEYQAFIDSHGGSHNAFTAYDRTNYYFAIDQQHLAPALDRFSQFFIAPLFSPAYVEREKNAVHSEYQARMKDSFRRSFAVFKQQLNPKHPLSNFAIGNLTTLADKPQQTVRDALLEFYADHYSADKMTLAILGKAPVNELKQLAIRYFAEIPQHSTTSSQASPALFEPGKLPMLARVKSLKEQYELSLLFPVPSSLSYYREKPLFYLSSLLGDESKGSLVQILKDKGWIKSLGAGPGFNYQDNGSLQVSITLTQSGYQHYEDIIALTFAYIDLIKQQGIDAERYAQEAALSDISFQFQEKAAPAAYVIGLSGNLARYPGEEVIYGDYQFAQFDPALIAAYLNRLTPDNLYITLSSANEPTDQRDPWFETDYRIDDWSIKSPLSADAAALAEQLALPQPNPFVPEDLAVRTGVDTEIPRLALVKPGLRLWHQMDADFPTPRSNFYLTFRSPVANDSAIHRVATQLYINLVKKALNTELYPAELVGYDINLYSHARGFSLRLQGYRDKQVNILNTLIPTLKNLNITPQQLRIAKDSFRQGLENKSQEKPYQQTMAEVYQNLLNPSWTDEQQLSALEWITPSYLQDFAQQLLSIGELEMLAHGNITQPEAIALAQPITETLYPELVVRSVPRAWVSQLPTEETRIQLAVPHTDNAMTLYAQAKDETVQTQAQYLLLEQLLGTRFYSQLRTEEQLGYIVYASFFPVYSQPGLAFVVQSPVADAQALVARTQTFIEQQQEHIGAVTEQQLQQYKNSILAGLLQREQTLETRTNRYWQELDRGYIDFNSREWLAKAVNDTKLDDLKQALAGVQQRQLIITAVPES